jgi:hypothetical protein
MFSGACDAFEAQESNFEKGIIFYLILSLICLIDCSDLRYMAASVLLCTVFRCPFYRISLGSQCACMAPSVHAHSLCPIPGCRSGTEERRQGTAWRAPRYGLQASDGSVQCSYVAGCALGSRRRRRLLKGRAPAGGGGCELAQGERISGRAAGAHGGTDAGSGKGCLIFLYSLLPRSCMQVRDGIHGIVRYYTYRLHIHSTSVLIEEVDVKMT